MGYKRTLVRFILTAVITAFCAMMTLPAYAERHSKADYLLHVGDTVVQRIMPKPESDSLYISTIYTEIHFRLNKADLDIDYMDNGLALLSLDRIIDSLGIENISAIEIISQSSPEGSLDRNTWLTEHRSKVMMEYMYRVFPDLKEKISMNKVTESWENLAQYVFHDPNLEEETKQKILDIIDSEKLSVAAKKSRLKNTLGSNPKTGDLYTYLTKYYYPVIRNSGIYILHMLEPEPEFQQDPERPYIEEQPVNPQDINYKPIEILPEQPVRKRPVLAVKTNLPYYAFGRKDLGWAPIYNIELEWYPSELGRWTWLAEWEFPWHSVPDKHQYFQIQNWQIEGRRYFKQASRHSGHYLSAYVGINYYDICFERKTGHGYQGEGFGGGLGYGYVIPLGKNPNTRWKMELFVKGGFYMSFYDPYDAGSPFAGKYYYDWIDSPSLFIKRNRIFRWLGPTGGGISLSYDLVRKTPKSKEKK